jgi:hypothetical protein
MEAVYKKIVDTFNDHPEVFTDRKLPVMRQIDIYLGQPDDPENFEVFCPAMFIDWQINPGANSEPDKLIIELHIIQEPGTPTDNFTPTLDNGLEYMRLLNAAKYLINKLKTDETTPFVYAGERPRVTPFFKYHVISYSCNIDQYKDSIHRPVMGTGTLEKIKIDPGLLQQKKPEVVSAPDIDIFKG